MLWKGVESGRMGSIGHVEEFCMQHALTKALHLSLGSVGEKTSERWGLGGVQEGLPLCFHIYFKTCVYLSVICF